MKTKNLAIIFCLFLFITAISGLTFFLTKEKVNPKFTDQIKKINFIGRQTEEKNNEIFKSESAPKIETKPELKAEVEQGVKFKPVAKQVNNENIEINNDVPGEVKIDGVISVGLIIKGVKYDAKLAPESTALDLMNFFKQEKKLDFRGKNYGGLGFFVEQINGIKNDPGGKNWVYYINGQPAPVGVSNYKIKANDIIEWKYENKSF